MSYQPMPPTTHNIERAWINIDYWNTRAQVPNTDPWRRAYLDAAESWRSWLAKHGITARSQGLNRL